MVDSGVPCLSCARIDGLVAVVVPARVDGAGLPGLVDGLAAALDGCTWRLRLVIGADAGERIRPAHELARSDPRVGVTGLTAERRPDALLRQGLVSEPDAALWACLDRADRDRAPAVPLLLDRLLRDDVEMAVLGPGEGGRWASSWWRAAPAGPTAAGPAFAVGPRGRAAILADPSADPRRAVERSGLPAATVPGPWRGRAPVVPGGRSRDALRAVSEALRRARRRR